MDTSTTGQLPASLPRETDTAQVWGRAAVVGTLALALVRLLYAPFVEVAPQEAYYWQYGRHLALSYFDHPPMCAWLIALSTRLLGATELGVRLPAVLCGVALSLLLASLGRRLYSPAAGAFAALAGNATVLLGLGSVVMTPDVPLVVCWAAALRVLCELVLPDGKGPGRFHYRWYLLGALCGLGMLSKYTAGLLLPQILLTALLSERGRAALRTPHPYLAVLVTLLVFSPVLVWNATHGWASFAFQTSGRVQQVHGLKPFLLGRYLGLQAVAVGPVLYVALWVTAFLLAREAWRGEPRARLLILASAPGLLLFSAVAPYHWVKLNWVAPCYLALMVGLAGFWDRAWSQRRVRVLAWSAVASSSALMLGMYLIPLVPQVPFSGRDALTNGWRELASAVETHRARITSSAGHEPLVVGWGYKTASELAFYLPGQPETQSDGVLGEAGLQYDYWLGSEALNGRDLLVVSDRRQPLHNGQERLSERCASVEALGEVTVHRGASTVTTFDLWHCREPRQPLAAGKAN
ncbi:glycosyltransferase family 39 protein [Vitiosangium sp. GDMCC 1.1324]|uniref:glycosyltransferase family 39 protein n=1 Tax=Vitiosangium sp. (strain GDMCC 1.1324) TaxID=2138576 RepID=UPI000D36DE5F|nr:glycosyltransferase family 39 protein [Vitiosangium sp. GDMCC 1.1324]PTL81746.1 4-amino-4-deoxy-L-arabinose transferase [Vitiosangium sp. GDMCC 1.1324]